jgi:hypothetical protein
VRLLTILLVLCVAGIAHADSPSRVARQLQDKEFARWAMRHVQDSRNRSTAPSRSTTSHCPLDRGATAYGDCLRAEHALALARAEQIRAGLRAKALALRAEALVRARAYTDAILLERAQRRAK